MQSILGNTRKADIIFYSSGRIDITASVAKAIDLQSGDVIDIMCGGGEFYLYIKHHAPAVGRHEGTAYPSNQKGSHFRVWSKTLCTAILMECKVTDQKVKLCVGTPVSLNSCKALPIITKNVIRYDKRDQI